MNLKTHLLDQGFDEKEVDMYLELALEHDDDLATFTEIEEITVDPNCAFDYECDFREYREERR